VQEVSFILGVNVSNNQLLRRGDVFKVQPIPRHGEAIKMAQIEFKQVGKWERKYRNTDMKANGFHAQSLSRKPNGGKENRLHCQGWRSGLKK
jgi:hypothetical protein